MIELATNLSFVETNIKNYEIVPVYGLNWKFLGNIIGLLKASKKQFIRF